VTNERGSQSITVSAKTVAEAISEAETRLGLARDEIDITVISEGSKGFLGMGGENARILALPKAILSRRSPDTTRSTTARATPSPIVEGRQFDEDIESSPLVSRARKQAAAARQENPMLAPEPVTFVAPPVEADGQDEADVEPQPETARTDQLAVADVAVEVVRELMARMAIDATASVRSAGTPIIIDVMGDDLGLLIGRHGDTLASLQYLVNAIVGRRVNRWCKVIVDVEHYRLRRDETLRSLANRQASRVRQSNQEITLDPMPANERRVVHMTLQNSPWVVTNSVGEEPNRSVVIAPRQGNR
jgi:spoIIIJ-associated protein